MTAPPVDFDGTPYTPSLHRSLNGLPAVALLSLGKGRFGKLATFALSDGRQCPMHLLSKEDLQDPTFSQLSQRDKTRIAKHLGVVMSNMIPFQFENTSIRVVADENGEALFVGKDICDALGYARSSDAMQQHCKGAAIYRPLQTPGGMQELRVLSEPDVMRLMTHSTLPAAEAFERLIFEEILPSIRKTGSYTAPGGSKTLPHSALAPSKEFRALFGIARLVGLDKNAAALSANQAVKKMTGTNVLALLGQIHIEAENQAAMYFTPTELGERMNISGRKFNMLLAEAGLQAKNGEQWSPLPSAEGFYRILDTGKRHGNGAMIQQVKWADNVLALVEKAAA